MNQANGLPWPEFEEEAFELSSKTVFSGTISTAEKKLLLARMLRNSKNDKMNNRRKRLEFCSETLSLTDKTTTVEMFPFGVQR